MSACASGNPGSSSIELRLGGLTPLSSCDWPGELAAVLFCRGCAWACPYCHNRHLMPAAGPSEPSWAEAMAFLGRRRGLLDGVVFSGGEPTLQRDLGPAMAAVRALSFRVGLHSAGPCPERLAAVLPLVDWVGFDVKAPFADYDRVTGAAGSGGKARESLIRLLAAGVPYEVRTTAHPGILDAAALLRLAGEIAALGVTRYALQVAHQTGSEDSGQGYLRFDEIVAALKSQFQDFTLRGSSS